MRDQTRQNFIAAIVLSLLTAICLLAGTYCMGRYEFFRYLNRDLGTTGDFIFRYATWLGDGVVWAVVVVLTCIDRRKLIWLVLSSLVLSTLITQGVKHWVFPGLARPTLAMEIHLYKIHTVPGVELLTADSFPSGHTATAFSVFLVGCLLIPKRWFVAVGFLYALLVGYSRIYLAEHFPLDVAGGIIAAVIAVVASFFIQKRISPSSFQ